MFESMSEICILDVSRSTSISIAILTLFLKAKSLKLFQKLLKFYTVSYNAIHCICAFHMNLPLLLLLTPHHLVKNNDDEIPSP